MWQPPRMDYAEFRRLIEDKNNRKLFFALLFGFILFLSWMYVRWRMG